MFDESFKKRFALNISKFTALNTHLLFFLVLAIVFLVNVFLHHHETFATWVEITGTIFQIALPCYAIVPVLWKKDKQGALQMIKVLCVVLAITWLFKLGLGSLLGINEIRPGGGRWSFPSGHTAGAFIGAVYLSLRYGLRYASICVPLAVFVAFSRLYVHAHWPTDVYASIFLCAIVGLLFVRPFKVTER